MTLPAFIRILCDLCVSAASIVLILWLTGVIH